MNIKVQKMSLEQINQNFSAKYGSIRIRHVLLPHFRTSINFIINPIDSPLNVNNLLVSFPL